MMKFDLEYFIDWVSKKRINAYVSGLILCFIPFKRGNLENYFSTPMILSRIIIGLSLGEMFFRMNRRFDRKMNKLDEDVRKRVDYIMKNQSLNDEEKTIMISHIQKYFALKLDKRRK